MSPVEIDQEKTKKRSFLSVAISAGLGYAMILFVVSSILKIIPMMFETHNTIMSFVTGAFGAISGG